MVSQSQDNVEWAGNGSPSRTGSLLSLDSRQRPAPVKTPPSYYDAVRSRHSLSQPRPADTNGCKQEKGHPVQQVKYNSLPRPLPQRYPAGQPQHRPWTEDRYDSPRANSVAAWNPEDQPAGRQLYDSPPKPANHVPLQLQVHGHHAKRGLGQAEHYAAPGAPDPRSSQRMNGGPRLTADCSARGNNSANMVRKESLRGTSTYQDGRPYPAVPSGGHSSHLRSPKQHVDLRTNSLPRHDPHQQTNGLLRRCYTLVPDGSPVPPQSYPGTPKSNVPGCPNYEPRYSKSGKLCSRPLSQGFESKPMPPPAVQLRTGPLGSYPDAETLKRSEMANYGRNFGEYDKGAHRTHSDVSQQIYIDTSPYANAQSAITDHLAIPYRIPQISPKNSHPAYDGCNDRKEHSQRSCPRGQPSPASARSTRGSQLSLNARPEDLAPNGFDRRNQDSTKLFNGSSPSHGLHNGSSKQSSPNNRLLHQVKNEDAIYANHQMSFHGSGQIEHPDLRTLQMASSPLSNGNAAPYDNKAPLNGGLSAVYANQAMANGRYGKMNTKQENSTPLATYHPENEITDYRNQRNAHRSPHPPPPAAAKPLPNLPPPSEMVMITETRRWNGQSNLYSKDVVKPTPRLPRYAGTAPGAPLATIPSYQCVIGELSNQSSQQSLSHSSDSSTLSLKSGYESSNNSVVDYGRQPSKSDSCIDRKKFLEGNSKGPHPRIEKSLLSASLSSLCSDASSSVSSRRRRYLGEDPNWDRMNEEFQKRKDKGSVFSASPWEREEKEKLQQEQILDARRARDQEIAYLESISERSEKQEEWLRILRLEREFQRRAEQELRDDDDEDDEEEVDVERLRRGEEDKDKKENFHGDKANAIPNERTGLKLLDELLESSSKNSTLENREFSKSPSEKHFIPLELTIPDRDLHQPSSLPLGGNILQVLDAKSAEHAGSKSSKPPIPAPRPSKAYVMSKMEMGMDYTDTRHDGFYQNNSDLKTAEPDGSSLAKLEIPDSGSVCDGEIVRDHPQDSWLFEVSSFESASPIEKVKPPSKPNGDFAEEPRIYENIMEIHSSTRQQNPPQNGFGSHTLPKSTNHAAAVSRIGSCHFEKKFPAMGVSSTLTRKMNGYSACDNDILPALYASSKLKSTQKELPSDLEDKPPEFKKLWISRPEKLSFQEKIKKFSIQAGEDDVPRDRVKNSRAQREIESKFSEGQKKAAAAAAEV